MTDDWQIVNPRLKRIAENPPSPFGRECGRCRHRHPKGERCGHYTQTADPRLTTDLDLCRCAS